MFKPANTGDTPGELVPGEDDAPRKCVLCDRALAVFGILLGAVFLYISIDILTGQKLTGLLSGARAEVIEND